VGVNTVAINFRGKDTLSRATRKNKKEMKQFRNEMARAKRAARFATRELNKTKRAIDKMSRSARKARKGGGLGLGGKIGVAAVATGGLLLANKGLSEAAKLEFGIAKVMSLVRDPKDQAAYQEKIERIIRENVRLGRSVEEVTEAVFQQISASGLSEQSFENLGAGMKLAIGGFADSGQSIKAVTKLLANFPELAGDARKAANILFTGQVFGQTDVGELANRLPQLASLAAAQGLGAQETVALVSLLTKKLGTTGQAVTATRGLILSLSQSTEQARKTLQGLGVPATIQEFQRLGLEESLLALNRAAEIAPEKMREAIPEVDALTAAFALNKSAIGELRTIQTAMNEDIERGTGLNDSFNRVMGLSFVKQAQAAEAANELLGVFGKSITPSVNRERENFTQLATAIVDKGFFTAIADKFKASAVEQRARLIDEGIIQPNAAERSARLAIEVNAGQGTDATVTETEATGFDVGVQNRGG
jgi:TP901 family phage tail tape measure protein